MLSESYFIQFLINFFFYFSRFFIDAFTLKEHKRSKQHKQRVKELQDIPYSHEESERAGGMGSYILEKEVEMKSSDAKAWIQQI